METIVSNVTHSSSSYMYRMATTSIFQIEYTAVASPTSTTSELKTTETIPEKKREMCTDERGRADDALPTKHERQVTVVADDKSLSKHRIGRTNTQLEETSLLAQCRTAHEQRKGLTFVTYTTGRNGVDRRILSHREHEARHPPVHSRLSQKERLPP